MALFQNEKKTIAEMPPIAPKIKPSAPPITAVVSANPTLPTPFEKEETRAITKEINPRTPQKDEPFFVRIDKFNQAKDNFEDISRKLNDLERLLTKMDELKAKENSEIDKFKKDTQEIKQTLTEVDKEIFSKL